MAKSYREIKVDGVKGFRSEAAGLTRAELLEALCAGGVSMFAEWALRGEDERLHQYFRVCMNAACDAGDEEMATTFNCAMIGFLELSRRHEASQ